MIELKIDSTKNELSLTHDVVDLINYQNTDLLACL